MQSNATIISALHSIDPSALDYAEWLTIGMALKAEGASVNDWDSWSARDTGRYKPGVCAKKWNTFNRTGASGGTIVYMARKNGWQPPHAERNASSVMTSNSTANEPDDRPAAAPAEDVRAMGGSWAPLDNRGLTDPGADWDPDADFFIFASTVFKPGDIINIVTESNYDKEKDKYTPRGCGRYLSFEDISAASAEKNMLAPITGKYNEKCGVWCRINPVDGHGVADANITAYRHALVESDTLPIEEQYEAYIRLQLPIAVLVTSGGKSLHALVKINAKDKDEYDGRVQMLHKILEREGIAVDKANKNCSRLSRLPGVVRNGQKQRLVAKNIGLETWDEWLEFMEGQQTIAPMLSLFKTLDEYEERKPRWLVDGLLPKGQICCIAGDGGTGKSGIVTTLTAAITTGKACFLDPPYTKREPGTVMFCSAEDSIRERLKRRVRIAGADMSKVYVPDFGNDPEGLLKTFKFGSLEMQKVIARFKPTLCIFDPIQSFIPIECNMSARNQMRQCLQPLVSLGERYGTTFVIVSHTNKRQNASGRDRIADSADLWDICRSVFITGRTDRPGIRYLSNEKNSYAELAKTYLYQVVDEGQLQYVGDSERHDADFQAEKANQQKVAPSQTESCAAEIKNILRDGDWAPINDVENAVLNAGYSQTALKKAKAMLREQKQMKWDKRGDRGNQVWWVCLTGDGLKVGEQVENEEYPD